EWTEGKLTGDLFYNELHYLLASLFGGVTPAQNGSASNRGYSWTHNPSTSAEDVPKTFTIEQGDSVRAYKFGYGTVTDLDFKWDRKSGAQLSGSLMGQLLSDGITLTPVVDDVWTLTITGTPTGGTFTLTADVNGSTQTTAAIAYNATVAAVQTALEALTNIGSGNVTVAGTVLPGGTQTVTFSGQLAGLAVTLTSTHSFTGGTTPASSLVHSTSGSGPNQMPIAPVLGSQIDVYIDSSAAALGTTKMTRVFSGEWSIASKYKPIWTLNSANTSFTAHIEDSAIKATAKLELEADDNGMNPLVNMRAGSTQFIRIAATGPQIDSSPAFDYMVQIDMAAQVSAPQEFKDSDGVYAIGYDFTLVTDDTWGKAMSILIQNEESAY
ncbi:MAG: hypothetical protein ACRDF8_10160, partial [Chloroflexota bacterium]